MGLVVGPRWTQKPPPGTDLDRAHAWCPDHAWPFLSPSGSAGSLAKAAPLAAISSTGDLLGGVGGGFSPGRKYGLSARFTTVNNWARLTADNLAEVAKVIPLSGGWTFLICSRKTDATLRTCQHFGVLQLAPAFTDQANGMMPWSDGIVYFDFGGSTVGTNRVQASGLTFGDDLWVFSTGPRGMEIWQNGILRASNGANPVRTNSVAGNHFGIPGAGSGSGDVFEAALAMSWRRQLPAAAIQALSTNPWQVFQPVSQPWWLGAAGDSAGSGGGASGGSWPGMPWWVQVQGAREAMERYTVWKPITLSNTANIPSGLTQGIWVGTGGDIAAVQQDGTMPGVLPAVPTGCWLPLAALRINVTGTTASNLWALYQV